MRPAPDRARACLPPAQALDNLANRALALWELPDQPHARLINLSENATYLVEAAGSWKSILRVHRPGYHSKTAIACELAWAGALRREGCVATPDVLVGRNGNPIQTLEVQGLRSPRHLVMFQFVEGRQPEENQDLVGPFETLGEIAARTHLHAMQWDPPTPFERLTWDLDAVFGANATWGNWRDAPNITPAITAILERAENTVIRRLRAYGTGPDRYGLIHADMRLANLLLDEDRTWLIDFDDCGMSWHLYDFAAAISFMEDHPQVPDLKQAWIKGYCKIHTLTDEAVKELDSFVMLRRLALLAWIGSHMESTEPQTLAPHFARVTAELGENYLSRFG